MPLLLLVAFLLLGCTQPFEPSDVAGRYALERVRDMPLPLRTTGPGDEPMRLLSSYFILRPDGTAETVTQTEELWGPGAPRYVEQRTAWVFSIDGTRILLRSPPCQGVCLFPTLSKMELRLIGDALVTADRLVYHRAGVLEG